MRNVHVLLLVLALGAAAAGIAYLLLGPGVAGLGTGGGIERGGSPPSALRPAPASGGDVALLAAHTPDRPERTAQGGREDLPGSAAAPARTGRAAGLRGRVVDGQGLPVAGARVLLGSGQGGMPMPLDLLPAGNRYAPSREEVRSGADGTFRAADIQASGLRLAVRAPGYAPLRTDLVHPGAGGDLGDLELEPSVVLEGRVTDERGRPVPGVEVHSLPSQRGGMMFAVFSGDGTRMTETDEEGAFRLDELAAGPYSLRFQHPAHPDLFLEGVTERPGEQVTGLLLELEPGLEVRGWVRGLDVEDTGTLRVRARERISQAGGLDWSRMPRPRSTEIRADGSFVVAGLREGRAVELAVTEAEAGIFGGDRSPTVVATAGDRGVELALRADAVLVLQVVDGRSGEPVENLRVEAGGRWRAPLRDGGGQVVEHFPGGKVRYERLDASGAGRASVRVTAEGYETFEREGLAVRPGHLLDLGVVALVPAPLLEVRVVAATTGEPVEGARVRLAEWSRPDPRARLEGLGYVTATGFAGPSDSESRSGRTDADGLARVTALVGRTCTLTVSHPEHVDHQGEPFLVSQPPYEPLAVHLERGGSVLVRVVDPSGEPQEGVNVYHQPPAAGDGGSLRSFGRPRQSGREGSVTFDRLPPGLHGFRVDDGASGGVFSDGFTVRIAGGSSRAEALPEMTQVEVGEGTHAELVLTAPQRAALTGRVLEGGRPLAGAALSLQRQEGEDARAQAMRRMMGGAAQARSGSDGRYAFQPVAVGPYQVLVTHPSRAMSFETTAYVEAGGSELVVELPLTSISGLVLDDRGRPVEGASVSVAAVGDAKGARGGRVSTFSTTVMASAGGDVVNIVGGGDSTGVRTDARGRYELRGVSADRDLEVRAEAGGDWRPARSAPLRLRPDESLKGIDIVLAPGGSLSVSVLRADGSAATACVLSADFAGPGEERPEPRREFVNPGGIVRLGGLQPGLWRLSARPVGPSGAQAGRDPVEVEVRASEELPVVVRLP